MTVKEYWVAWVKGICLNRISAGPKPRTYQYPKKPTHIMQIPMFIPMISRISRTITPMIAMVR